MVPISLRERVGVRGAPVEIPPFGSDRSATSPHPDPLPEGEGDRIAAAWSATPTLLQDGVVVFVAGGAAAEKPQHARAAVGDAMMRSRRDGDRVAGTNRLHLIADLHQRLAFENEVDLFGLQVVVRRRARAGGEPGLGERLIANARVAMREQFADFRAVLGDKGRRPREALDVHEAFPS